MDAIDKVVVYLVGVGFVDLFPIFVSMMEERKVEPRMELSGGGGPLILLEGYLKKKNTSGVSGLRSWRNRFVSLTDQGVNVFPDLNKIESIATIRWEDVKEVHYFPDKKGGTRFDLNPSDGAPHQFQARDRSEAQRWVDAMTSALQASWRSGATGGSAGVGGTGGDRVSNRSKFLHTRTKSFLPRKEVPWNHLVVESKAGSGCPEAKPWRDMLRRFDPEGTTSVELRQVIEQLDVIDMLHYLSVFAQQATVGTLTTVVLDELMLSDDFRLPEEELAAPLAGPPSPASARRSISVRALSTSSTFGVDEKNDSILKRAEQQFVTMVSGEPLEDLRDACALLTQSESELIRAYSVCLYWALLKILSRRQHLCQTPHTCATCAPYLTEFANFVSAYGSGELYSRYVKDILHSLSVDGYWLHGVQLLGLSATVHYPEVWKAYFMSLRGSDDSLVQPALVDANSLLITCDDNVTGILEQSGWQLWLLPLIRKFGDTSGGAGSAVGETPSPSGTVRSVRGHRSKSENQRSDSVGGGHGHGYSDLSSLFHAGTTSDEMSLSTAEDETKPCELPAIPLGPSVSSPPCASSPIRLSESPAQDSSSLSQGDKPLARRNSAASSDGEEEKSVTVSAPSPPLPALALSSPSQSASSSGDSMPSPHTPLSKLVPSALKTYNLAANVVVTLLMHSCIRETSAVFEQRLFETVDVYCKEMNHSEAARRLCAAIIRAVCTRIGNSRKLFPPSYGMEPWPNVLVVSNWAATFMFRTPFLSAVYLPLFPEPPENIRGTPDRVAGVHFDLDFKCVEEDLCATVFKLFKTLRLADKVPATVEIEDKTEKEFLASSYAYAEFFNDTTPFLAMLGIAAPHLELQDLCTTARDWFATRDRADGTSRREKIINGLSSLNSQVFNGENASGLMASLRGGKTFRRKKQSRDGQGGDGGSGNSLPFSMNGSALSLTMGRTKRSPSPMGSSVPNLVAADGGDITLEEPSMSAAPAPALNIPANAVQRTVTS